MKRSLVVGHNGNSENIWQIIVDVYRNSYMKIGSQGLSGSLES